MHRTTEPYSYHDLIRDLRSGPFTSLGSYPTAFYTNDGEMICHKCVKDNLMQVARATRDRDHSGWDVIGFDVYWEGPTEYCAHGNCEIESAYGDPDAPEETETEENGS